MTKGFDKPNYTQTPNQLFDEYLPLMGYAELKVVMVLVRKTFGYHKEKTRVSIRKLSRLTGLSPRNAYEGAEKAIERGIVTKENDGGVTLWGVSVWDTSVSVEDTGVVVRDTPSIKEKVKEKDKQKASAKPTRPNDKHFDAILSVCCPDEQLTESYKQANKSWIAKTANNGCREFPAELITKAYGAGGWWYEVRCKNITPKPTPTPESIKKTITLAAAYYKSLNQAETKVYDDGSFDA